MQQKALESLKKYKETNILILGETGVGKSTFLNNLANQLAYFTLEEAMNGQLITLIYNKHMKTNRDGEDIEVVHGECSDDQDTTVGSSTTQVSTVYRFVFGDNIIRIIDTPGLGDVRGVKQDDINFDNILYTISTLDHLNGIIILLKPNQSTLSITFRYCLDELLTHLHKSAINNMVFAFTNSRNIYFEAGDTYFALKKVLKAKNTGIQLTEEKVYYLESECYRFLAEIDVGIQHTPATKQTYSGSWERSLGETQRLLTYLVTLDPHQVKNTLSLNDARRLLQKTSEPLANLTKSILFNIEESERVRKTLENPTEEELKKEEVTLHKTILEARKLDFPRTVCTNTSCVEYVKTDDIVVTNYVTWCHEHCYLPWMPVKDRGNKFLWICKAINIKGTCKKCKHPLSDHMHITEEYIQVKKPVEQISLNPLKVSREEKIKEIANKIEQYKKEQAQINKVTAKFAYFVKKNSITSHSDSRAVYLQHLINEEESKPPELINNEILKGLKKEKAQYQEQVKLIENPVDGVFVVIDCNNVKELIEELRDLPEFGENCRELFDYISNRETFSAKEKSHRVLPHNRIYQVINAPQKVMKEILGKISNISKKSEGKNCCIDTIN